jgi:hypothetical protein
VVITEQDYAVMLLRVRAAVALADVQVILLRNLATRLQTSEADAGGGLRVQATADQLEAAARETRRALPPELTPPHRPGLRTANSRRASV